MNHYILDENGNPVIEHDYQIWSYWMENNNRHLALDEIGDVKVSTVFLGIDHSWSRSFTVKLYYEYENPILWETMIFGGERDGYQNRFCSKESALEGHAYALSLVKPIPYPSLSKPKPKDLTKVIRKIRLD